MHCMFKIIAAANNSDELENRQLFIGRIGTGARIKTSDGNRNQVGHFTRMTLICKAIFYNIWQQKSNLSENSLPDKGGIVRPTSGNADNLCVLIKLWRHLPLEQQLFEYIKQLSKIPNLL